MDRIGRWWLLAVVLAVGGLSASPAMAEHHSFPLTGDIEFSEFLKQESARARAVANGWETAGSREQVLDAYDAARKFTEWRWAERERLLRKVDAEAVEHSCQPHPYDPGNVRIQICRENRRTSREAMSNAAQVMRDKMRLTLENLDRERDSRLLRLVP